MRRLAIVDLAGGQQPFINEAGDIQLVANGEIYNFRELRRELEGTATAFRSRSDIEVLVHAYEQWGEDFLPGCAACSRWRCGTAARARCSRHATAPARSRSIGRQTPYGLLLGSEVKALLVRPEVSRELDLEALDQFLTYEYIVAPRTILKDMHKLPAGALSALSRRRRSTVHRYWDAADVPAAARGGRRSRGGAAARRCGRRSSRQMMADVPIGAFLSGGIDSSAIVALDERGGAASADQQLQHGLRRRQLQRAAVSRARSPRCSGRNHRERTVSRRHLAGCSSGWSCISTSRSPTSRCSRRSSSRSSRASTSRWCCPATAATSCLAATTPTKRRRWRAARLDGRCPACPRSRGVARSAAAADREEEGAGQQGQALQRTARRRAPADLGHYRWMVVSSAAARRRGCITPACASALRRHRRLRAGARGAGAIRPGRSAQPPALCRPEHLSGGRHPGEGRSHEHGDVARNARAVPRRAM